MGLPIRNFSEKAIPFQSIDCLGCGHCVDVCPTGTLLYETNFTRLTGVKPVSIIPVNP
ncbi:MAG: 4Fe-4S binding protein [Spirochaetales bacterium]|nr:4Fe-4S binding protein [Spirochaetales bacterium]